MRRIRKSNARDVLLKTCDKIHNLTGEVVGILMTWKGSIYVSGPEISVIWYRLKRMQCGSLFRYSSKASKPSPISPCRDKDMQKLMIENCNDLSRQTLRKMVSWSTRQCWYVTFAHYHLFCNVYFYLLFPLN